jgi:hypothetical protein
MRIIIFIVALFLTVSTVFAKQISGTSVNITLPESYIESDRFSGLTNEASGSSIVVTELPALFDKAIEVFSDVQRMKKKGMTLINKSPVKISGQNGMLFHVEQPAYGLQYKKWILAIDYNQSTTLIVASYPESASDQESILREALLNATFSQASNPVDTLRFSITPKSPFKVARVFANNNMLVTPNGEFPVNDDLVPFMVIGLSLSDQSPIASKKLFSEDLAKHVATVKNITIEKTVPVKIGGLSGYETIATGEKEDTQTPLTVYQVILFDNSGYSIIKGLAPKSKKSTILPIFMEMAGSFRFR